MMPLNFRRFKYSFLESLALNLLAFIVFFILNPVREDFMNMNLHPLLIITAFMAMKYGNYLGLLSATISTIIFIYSYSLLGKDLYLFFTDFAHYKFLLMFYLSAIVLGKFKDDKEKQRKYKTLKEKYEKLQKNHEKTKLIKEELQEQIVGAEESILSLYEIASSLESLDAEEIYTGIMKVLAKFLQVKRASIYTLNDKKDFLRLKLCIGKQSELENSIDLNENSYFKSVVNNKEVIKKPQGCLSETPLFSAPLIDDKKEVIGIINVEKMNFEMITAHSYNLFKIIIDWTNKSLARALLVEKRVSNEKYYKSTDIIKYEQFKKRLTEERIRRNRYDMSYGLIKFKKGNYNLNKLDEIFKNLIRDVDIVAYNEKAKTIYVLFPVTPNKFIPKIRRRILKAFNHQLEMIA